MGCAPSGRLAEFGGGGVAASHARTPADELIRGADGWSAVRGDGGQYTIGVEWDTPRELSEVNIEFRHAIANREEIKVQYWKAERTSTRGGGKPGEERLAGRWMTPNTDW